YGTINAMCITQVSTQLADLLMMDTPPKIRLAAVQASPVWMERDATIQKACRPIEEAADHGANVIGLPEGFIPGFPDWYSGFMPYGPESVAFNKRLFKNAIEIPGPSVYALLAATRRTRTHVIIGINERVPRTLGTLYNSL